MNYIVYDKAKWHYGPGSQPMGLPAKVGAIHIAFFLRWCVENEMVEKEVLEELGHFNVTGKDWIDYPEFLVTHFSGVLDEELLNERGQAFAKEYYNDDTTKMAVHYDWYLQDYDTWVEQLFGPMYNAKTSMYEVEFDEENYKAVAEMIDRRYAQFLDFTAVR